MAIALLILVAVFAALLVTYLTTSRTVSERDIAWLANSPDSSGEESEVYRRYLERHRTHRIVGGVFGAVFAIVFGIRWLNGFQIGIGGGNPLGDILFCGLAGLLIGALSAETFRFNEPTSTTVAASLAARPEFVNPDYVRLARIITGVAAAIAVFVALISTEFAALFVAVAGAAIVGVAEATRSATTNRQRPVLSDTATRIDLQIRSFAAGSVTLLQLAAAVLTFGWVISKSRPLSSVFGILLFFVVLGCLVLCVRLLRQAAPRPPKGWEGVVR